MDVGTGQSGFLDTSNPNAMTMVTDENSGYRKNNNRYSQNQGHGGGYNQGGGYSKQNQSSMQHSGGGGTSDEDIKHTVFNLMKGKKAISRDELFSNLSCSKNQLESVLNRMLEDGRIANAQDDNHFFIVN